MPCNVIVTTKIPRPKTGDTARFHTQNVCRPMNRIVPVYVSAMKYVNG